MLCFDIYTYSPEKVAQEEKEKEEEKKARSFALGSPVKPTRSHKSLHNSSSGLMGSAFSGSMVQLTTPAIYRILELPVYMLLKEDLHLMIRELEKKSAITEQFDFQQEMHRMESSYSLAAFSPEDRAKVDSKRSTVYKSFIQMQEALGERGSSTVNPSKFKSLFSPYGNVPQTAVSSPEKRKKKSNDGLFLGRWCCSHHDPVPRPQKAVLSGAFLKKRPTPSYVKGCYEEGAFEYPYSRKGTAYDFGSRKISVD